MKGRWGWVIGALLAVLAGAPVLVPLFCPWTAINLRVEEINIKTGQARFSRYFWFVRVSQKVADTPISSALAGKVVDVAPVEPWRLAKKLSPGVRNSPYYAFYEALNQARQAGHMFAAHGMSAASRAEFATKWLTLCQITGSGSEAGKYLSDTSAKALESPATSQPAP